MTRARRLQRQQICAQRVFVGRAIGPKSASRFPIGTEPFVMRNRVLNNQRIDPFGMNQGHAKTHRASVVLHVKCVLREPQRFGETIHDLGIVIECVGELFWIGPVAVTKPGVIRRDEVIAIRNPFEKRFKHSR